MDFDTYERKAIFKYAEFAEMASKILTVGIASDPSLRLQQVQARAKSSKSLKKKLLAKKNFDTLNLENEIKDLAGCRAIFYTNSDVTRFVHSGLIQDNFEVLEARLHYPKNDESNDGSLYISQHFVLKFRPERLALIEYAHFSNMRFELQIQTILNHAWSEMEHDIGYKQPTLDGFGEEFFNSINMRLKKIMHTYLLPAGYEFQKVASDFERLVSGKKLFDENV
ncbi:RelA/SpoT domain-containing protein [Undibacterium umbellatum]|uniref:RelA/SpoT domain-containing protein n=1 Tax=Undibacterium umbellatum TaxID=2762300 RepID=A0ABR6ZC83_9BURK|nr:RelA/SpoT domain-containing protein [Undibacterium umbellatum]MBC3909366.1 RelA/SpoT domain-containing protein [Undibacterium umbellatum]